MNDNELEIRAQLHSLALMTSALRVLAVMNLAKVEQTREALWATIERESASNEYRRELGEVFEALMDDASALRDGKKP